MIKFENGTVLLAAAAGTLSACATAPSEIRTGTAPVEFQTSRSFDVFVGCISERVVTKFKMTPFPTERGTSFVYDYGNQGLTKAAMLVDVVRGTPVTAQVSIKGGPWLGRDKKLLELVGACANG